jgi:hypothetical protein
MSDDIKSLEARVARLEAALAQAPAGTTAVLLNTGPITDPAGPWGGGWGGGYRPVHWPIGDPAPVDYSRLPAPQLEATLHSIHAEKARLASLEAQVTQHLAKLKEKG